MNESGKDRPVPASSLFSVLVLSAVDGLQASGLFCRCVCGGADVARTGKQLWSPTEGAAAARQACEPRHIVSQVEVSRRVTLEKLPPVLVLHLKRFVYEKTGGCQKLVKNIDYPVDLEISKGNAQPCTRCSAPCKLRTRHHLLSECDTKSKFFLLSIY